MTQEERDILLIRLDERFKAFEREQKAHHEDAKANNIQLNKRISDVGNKVEEINKWRFGVIGAWGVALGSYFKS